MMPKNESNVFVLHHTYGCSESETYKLIGIFSSEELAKSAVYAHSQLPGFKDYPDGFEISLYQIDKSHWDEGFGFE
jgi:hypothetical protein